MALPFRFFTLFQLVKVAGVDSLLGKAAVAADVAIDVGSGKDGCTRHDMIARAVRTCKAVKAHDVVLAAFGAGIRVFHRRSLILRDLNDHFELGTFARNAKS